MIAYRVRTQETLKGKSDEVHVLKDEQAALKADHDAEIVNLFAEQEALKIEHNALIETLVAEQEVEVKALRAEINALKVA